MNPCPECENPFNGQRCDCGYHAPAKAADKWIVRYCATQGCGVRIRERVGNPGDPRCKWCQAGTAYMVKP